MTMAKNDCYRSNCFQNYCGLKCQLLTEAITDRDCPFFKTHLEMETERKKAHVKLVEKGRDDLIAQYEYNPFRVGYW